MAQTMRRGARRDKVGAAAANGHIFPAMSTARVPESRMTESRMGESVVDGSGVERAGVDESPPPAVLQVLPSLVTGGVVRGTIEITQAVAEGGGVALVASAGGRMVGWWTTLVGDLYEQVTIWEYEIGRAHV